MQVCSNTPNCLNMKLCLEKTLEELLSDQDLHHETWSYKKSESFINGRLKYACLFKNNCSFFALHVTFSSYSMFPAKAWCGFKVFLPSKKIHFKASPSLLESSKNELLVSDGLEITDRLLELHAFFVFLYVICFFEKHFIHSLRSDRK